MTKRRTGDPWMPADEYGRRLPSFTINLLVRDIEPSLAFYRDVLDATVHYADPDFAALQIGDLEFMLHADHAYDGHPWFERLSTTAERGLGAELRLFGVDPDAIAERAQAHGAKVVVPVADKGHGWRELMVADPDGYLWAAGRAI